MAFNYMEQNSKEIAPLEFFSDTTHHNYIVELNKILPTINTNNCAQFFQVLLRNFEKQIDNVTGNEILVSISKLLQDNQIAGVFSGNQYLLHLPITESHYHEKLFDLLYYLLKHHPNSLISDFFLGFNQLVRSNPKKSLVIFGYLAQNYRKIEDPIPLFDILFQEYPIFLSNEVFPDYSTLIIYLNKEYDQFRELNLIKCWNFFVKLMTSENDTTTSTCLFSLCALYDSNPSIIQSVEFPIDMIIFSLKTPNLTDLAISFLLRFTPRDTHKKMGILIRNLLRIGQNNKKATLVLLQMTDNEEVSRFLISNTQWIDIPLPTIQETVRLFANCLTHKKLRSQISDYSSIVNLYKILIDQPDISAFTIITTLTRRIEFDETFIRSLSKSGFIKTFIYLFSNSEDISILEQGLLFINRIALHVLLKDYLDFIPRLANLTKRKELREISANIAIKFATYPPLRSQLNEVGFDTFFQKKQSDPNFSKFSLKYFENIQSNPSE